MIRSETRSDPEGVRAVHCAAFPTNDEANLVDALRSNDHLLVSLVALDGSDVVGHVAFSPVTIENSALVGAGLAPISVLPSHQSRGISSELIEAGLETCRRAGIDFVVVLGEADFYGRFGFDTASKSGLGNEYNVDREFMVKELKPDCLAGISGLARYSDEFKAFS